MSSLLGQIREAAVSAKTDVGEVLRLCRVLASRIDYAPLNEWIEYELNGYPPNVPVPPYRVIDPVYSEGEFGNSLQRRVLSIPVGAIPKENRDAFCRVEVRDPISTCQMLLDGGGHVEREWPADLCLRLKPFVVNMQCLRAWMNIPTTAFKEPVELVRNKVLDFILEIEKVNPDAGERVGGEVSAQVTAQIFNTTILGNGNVANASSNFTQVAAVTVNVGDLPGLKNGLRDQGVPEPDIDNLELILADFPDLPRKDWPEKVSAWFVDLVAKGAGKIGAPLAANIIARLIASYLGIGS